MMPYTRVKFPSGGHGLRSLIIASFDLPKDAGVARLRELLVDPAVDNAGCPGRMRPAAFGTLQRGFPLEGKVVSFAELCLHHGRVDMLRAVFEMESHRGPAYSGRTLRWMQEFGVYREQNITKFRCIVHLAVERHVPASAAFIALALEADPYASEERQLTAVHEHAEALFAAARMLNLIEKAPPTQERAPAPTPARRRRMV